MKHEAQWCDVCSDEESGGDDSMYSGTRRESMRRTVLMSATVCQLTIQRVRDSEIDR